MEDCLLSELQEFEEHFEDTLAQTKIQIKLIVIHIKQLDKPKNKTSLWLVYTKTLVGVTRRRDTRKTLVLQ